MHRRAGRLTHTKMPEVNICSINTTSYIDPYYYPHFRVDFLQGIGYLLLFLLGLSINITALRAFIAKWSSWTDTHVYMLNLAIADSALVLALPFRVYDAFTPIPRTGLCTVLIFIHFINMYASILTTVAISVQRFLAIRFPVQARSWKRKKETAFAVCLMIWAILVTICAIFHENNHPRKLWTCFERCKDIPMSRSFFLTLELLGFIIPLLIMVFCSSWIISILSKTDGKSQEKRSVIGIVTANMIVFMVCYTPIHIAFLVNYLSDPGPNWQNETLHAHRYLLVSEFIASTNCCFDSISYYFLLIRFYL